MTRASTLQIILADQNKRIYLLLSFMTAFFLFHLLVKPFQLSHYSDYDFIRVTISYNVIALLSIYIGLIAIPKYLPSIFNDVVNSTFNRIAYLIFLLISIGLGIFIFKIVFGYYDFTLARVGTGISALLVFSTFIGLAAYTVDTKLSRTQIKEYSELTYWRLQKIKNPMLPNGHYEEFYTKPFGLNTIDFANKKVLDIGCGPRGSLEWVPSSTVAVGLDPLAKEYLSLNSGTKNLQMDLIEGYCEAIPFEDNSFDIVTSFNSIDHVEDIQQSANEIQRVLKPGGLLLLICDVNRKATLTEPHSLSINSIKGNFSQLTLKEEKLLDASIKFKIYANIRADKLLEDLSEEGILIAKFKKIVG